MSEDKSEKHPAYGTAVFTRTSGDAGRLFGSPLKDHHQTIAFTILRASIQHRHGRDWIFGSDEIIRVRFSPAQFAELLTTMNVGSGVPCTIEHIQGERVPPMPEDEPVEHEKVVDAFKEDVSKTVGRLRAGLKETETLLAKKSLTKEDKHRITWLIGKALQDVEHNAPFMLEQFGEAATKVVSHARAEMAAVVQSTVERLGMKSLKELRAAGEQATLSEKP